MTYLSTDAEQVDDVDMLSNHLHHVHFGDQIDHVVVSVALLEHLDGHDVAVTSGADDGGNFRFHDLNDKKCYCPSVCVIQELFNRQCDQIGRFIGLKATF